MLLRRRLLKEGEGTATASTTCNTGGRARIVPASAIPPRPRMMQPCANSSRVRRIARTELSVSHPLRVSVHGGHSGQFCHHAKDSLEDVVNAYIEAGFSWVAITEHMPPAEDAWRYPDEVEGGLSAATLQARFRDYFAECRRLREVYRNRIELFCCFETETY